MQWQLRLGLFRNSEDNDPVRLEMNVLDGFSTHAVREQHRGYLQLEELRISSSYELLIWAVPDELYKVWQQSGGGDVWYAHDGAIANSSQTESVNGRNNPAIGATRFEMLRAQSQEFVVDGLHVIVYAPGIHRVELSVDRQDFRRAISSDEVPTMAPQQIGRVEMYHAQASRHLADILFYPESSPLGYLAENGECVYPPAGKDLEEIQ